MTSDMPGVRIGHWTDLAAQTGCTVIAFDEPALTAVEVRGAAPGTRELDLLAPGRLVQRVNAILLTGGSTFGLRAADGVMTELAARGVGFPTSASPVPIVPAAVVYDLAVGEPIAPTADHGRETLLAAKPISASPVGRIGAGTGATVGKIDPPAARPGGLGIGQVAVGEYLVTSIVVLNAFGTVRGYGPDARAGRIAKSSSWPSQGQATSLIAVVTSAPCNHDLLTRMTVAAHDALARMVIPAHTMLDGDVAFASTVSEGPATQESAMLLTLATELATESAIANAMLASGDSGATLEP
jgi:L-aminopeptidase/D-esterase-like protein